MIGNGTNSYEYVCKSLLFDSFSGRFKKKYRKNASCGPSLMREKQQR